MSDGSSKILTVSYGAFSCTLEGFDEPIETMEAVTEYFRRLAAADPDFGSAPAVAGKPQPAAASPAPEETPLLFPEEEAIADAPAAETEEPPLDQTEAFLSEETAGIADAQPDDMPSEAALPMQQDGFDEFTEPDATPSASDIEARLMAELAAIETPPRPAEALVRDAAEEETESPEEALAALFPHDDLVSEEETVPLAASVPETGTEDSAEPAPTNGEDSEISVPETAAAEPLQKTSEPEASALAETAVTEPPFLPRHPEFSHPDTEATSPAGHPLPKDKEEDDVTRLMDKAEEEIAGSESRRRFAAISHLRAALSATMAERQHTEQPPAGKDQAPESDMARPPEGSSSHVAPLYLVSDQRVDNGAPCKAETVPLYPRKLPPTVVARRQSAIETALSPAEPEEEIGFEDFVRKLDPQELTDLLEAAAAYLVRIERAADFSRDDVMERIAPLDSDGIFTDEEKARAFDLLLRQGQIAGTRPDRYTLTQASRYFHRPL